MPTEPALREYLDFASDLARRAGEVTLRYFRQEIAVEHKRDASPVTIADRETELFIRREIMARYPEHGLLGEEFGTHQPGARAQWIIDPIDGTQAFIHGVPLYTVLLALLIDGDPAVGVIHNPLLNDTAAAATGFGCTLNGALCHVSQRATLAEARVHVTDFADFMARRPELCAGLLRATHFSRTWADAYGYLMVACGRAEVMLDPIMNPWDIACLIPIITESGGMITDLDGNPACQSGQLAASAVATNGLLHPQLLALHLSH